MKVIKKLLISILALIIAIIYMPFEAKAETSCEAGYYLDGETCTICPAGTYSEEGATSCTKCEAGTYNGSTGQSSCNTCPAGTYSEEGASACTDCNFSFSENK